MIENNPMSDSYTNWIIKVVTDDCTYTGLDLEDPDVREAIISGLRDAAEYIERLDKPFHQEIKMKKFYYLLVHDHKHGNSYSLHSTYEDAQTHGVRFMREAADEWGEDVSSYSDADLWSGWTNLSGETEFFSIEELILN